jgi:heat shock protein HtpX
MYEELEKNVRRTRILIAAAIGFALGIGYVVGMLLGGSRNGAAFGIGGLAIAGILSTIMSLVSYFSGDKIVLKLSRAHPASKEDDARLHNLVEGLCIAAGIPMPAIYVVEDPAPNAFATGRDPAHASIAVTRGLLDKMNRVELEGVLAHELAHIKNRDTLVMVITATLVGVAVLLADWSLRALFWGAGGGRRGGDREGGNALQLVFVVLGVIALILTPILAQVIKLAVSRRREFFADVAGVQMTRYPPGLISALQKLKEDQTSVRTATHATSHMWIEEPLDTGKGAAVRLNKLFSTHPPLDERIRVLREL